MKKQKDVRPFKGQTGLRPKKSLTAAKSVRPRGTKEKKVNKR